MSSLILRRRAILRGSALKIVRPAAFVAAGVCGLPDGTRAGQSVAQQSSRTSRCCVDCGSSPMRSPAKWT
jgi:hypothetical protein